MMTNSANTSTCTTRTSNIRTGASSWNRLKRAVEHAPERAAGVNADDKDQNGDDNLGPELDGEIDERAFGLVEQCELAFHGGIRLG